MRRKIQVIFTPEFERDLGWMLRHDRVTEDEVLDAVDYFIAGTPLPLEWRDHFVHGRWKGLREFHLSGSANNLIIYRRQAHVVQFLAMGGHEDLFHHMNAAESRIEKEIRIRQAKRTKERSKGLVKQFWDWLDW